MFRGVFQRCVETTLYGECFLSQDQDPYDKHDKPRLPPNTSRMPSWKALFPTRRLEPPRFVDHAVKQKLPEDYEKACTQLLAQFKTLKTFGQTEFDGRLEKTDHVESDVEREHLYNFRHQM